MTEKEFESFSNFIHELLYEKMSIDDYYIIMDRLGAKRRGDRFTSICHNIDGGGYNLAFIPSTRTFYCHSFCCSAYSLLSLIKKRRELLGLKCNTYQSLKWLCNELGIDFNFKEEIKEIKNDIYKWQNYLSKYSKNDKIQTNNIYDKYILECLDNCYYEPWINEGITKDIQDKFNIKWYNYRQQVVIPIYDDDGNFVGTHCRNTNPVLIDDGLKYYHLQLLNNFEYKFQMGLVLFGLNMNKADIERTKTAILFESPKSVMLMDNFYDYNISVGIFGMNFQMTKLKLLLKYGCTKFIIALDRQYQNVTENNEYTQEFVKYQEKINKIINMIKPYAEEISVIWDNDNDRYLDYKDSPVDKGKDIWEKLYNNREVVVINDEDL